ncbi:MAG: helix-turn-helix transcriptional regulator [Clostridia bacterium]|nr:helix-turn-helix transcriptional regulator [Clostridia bacterium]
MLKEARKKAGLSQQEAADRLNIGRRTLTSYENGHTIAPPEVVLKMAEVYGDQALPGRWCARACPIGRVIAYDYECDNLAGVVLGVLKEMDDAERVKSRLVAIAADGRLEGSELSEFARIIRELCELEREIGELKQFAAKLGVLELGAKAGERKGLKGKTALGAAY